MKKLLCILGLGLLFPGICMAEDSSFEDELLESARLSIIKELPFYRRLMTCGKFETNINSYDYKIHGIEDDKCHFQMDSMHCYFPQDQYKSHAFSEITQREKMLRDIKHGKLHFSSEDPAVQDSQKIIMQYCTYQF